MARKRKIENEIAIIAKDIDNGALSKAEKTLDVATVWQASKQEGATIKGLATLFECSSDDIKSALKRYVPDDALGVNMNVFKEARPDVIAVLGSNVTETLFLINEQLRRRMDNESMDDIPFDKLANSLEKIARVLDISIKNERLLSGESTDNINITKIVERVHEKSMGKVIDVTPGK